MGEAIRNFKPLGMIKNLKKTWKRRRYKYGAF